MLFFAVIATIVAARLVPQSFGLRFEAPGRLALAEVLKGKAIRHTPIAPVANPCPRSLAGAVVTNPPELLSRNGLLTVDFSYQTRTDSDGRQLFCFMTPDGSENPTLRLNPGDRLVINITNNTPTTSFKMALNPPNCGSSEMTSSSLNLHFHGTDLSPQCGQDEVIRTTINSGETLTYSVRIPDDEPPGLDWYHPHIHGLAEAAVQGGASGAIIIDGFRDFQPAISVVPQRVLMIRDQILAEEATPRGAVPSWDLTVNTVPIAFPTEIPAAIEMRPSEKQLWRVANATSNTILDLMVVYDGKPQPLQIVGLDGVPIRSESGNANHGLNLWATHVLIPTAGRAEFIVQGPASSVPHAVLMTRRVDTGPSGDNDPPRLLARILPAPASAQLGLAVERRVRSAVGLTWLSRFRNLASLHKAIQRKLYFSETPGDEATRRFFITIAGQVPQLFDANNPPTIVTTRGSVEDWTIENRTQENHTFHIHQTHFLVLKQTNDNQDNGAAVGQFLDTINIPYWDGDPNHPFPSVTVRMDFEGPTTGDFVYHCHILEHEDRGMMAIIRVMPSKFSATFEKARLQAAVWLNRWFRRNDSRSSTDEAWCIAGRVVTRRSQRPQAIDSML